MPRKNRDREFEQFYRSTKDQVFRALLVVSRDREIAEDAVSEAYTRALAMWDQVERHPAPSAWVAKTALNHVRSMGRVAARASSEDAPDIPVSDDPPTDPELLRSLLALPERQREVVALRIVLGLNTEQTAEFLGIAGGTVTTHLFRALTRLQEELSEIAPKEAWL
ncbi:MAG: sigma-70 family RNA polymerase sigma factor [Actinomycetota bacterium]|nr:sigma-70 family RNA polymerase sigma factor [Actinomycetota bacterium]